MDAPRNPFLEGVLALGSHGSVGDEDRDRLVRRYAFAVPSEGAFHAIEAVAPAGVVELGAGTGYWARMLHDRGVDTRAFDAAPPPADDNPWFAGSSPWFDVEVGDESVASDAPPAALLLVWPTRNEVWATAAARRYHDAGGHALVYVGEGPGGRTGDDTFHATLGELRTCNQCAYGIDTAPCICDVPASWRRVAEVALPALAGHDDSLQVYERIDLRRRSARRRLFTRRTREGTGRRSS